MSFAERILSAVWLGAATLAFAASLGAPDASVRVFLDNAAWSLAFVRSEPIRFANVVGRDVGEDQPGQAPGQDADAHLEREKAPVLRVAVRRKGPDDENLRGVLQAVIDDFAVGADCQLSGIDRPAREPAKPAPRAAQVSPKGAGAFGSALADALRKR